MSGRNPGEKKIFLQAACARRHARPWYGAFCPPAQSLPGRDSACAVRLRE